MSETNSRSVAKAQQTLDRGFQKSLALCRSMQDELKSEFGGGLELKDIERPDIETVLSRWAKEFYTEMGRTLFQVLQILQPEAFQAAKANFYFWPGYHSHFIGRRLFFQHQPQGKILPQYDDFGVGLFGDPGGVPDELEVYHDCSQARWYHYATMPPPQRDFFPASPYHWFAYQQPRISDGPNDLVASLTFSTDPSLSPDGEFPEHKVLHLADSNVSSQAWGAMVADVLNRLPHLRDREWKFPDRKDRTLDAGYSPLREQELRTARCLLISLWMHSVFRSKPPDWWEDLASELSKQGLDSVMKQLASAQNDPVAWNWGDDGSGRPGFTTWTTIALHPLTSEPPAPVIGPGRRGTQAGRDLVVYTRNIGWATILCSVPLDLPFISMARQWIRTVYGTLRNAETSVLLRNREPLVRAEQPLRFLVHEMCTFIADSFDTVLLENDDCSEKAIGERRFVLLTLRAQSMFAYAASSAPGNPRRTKQLKKEFLEKLLVNRDHLRESLARVARDVQQFHAHEGGASIDLPASHDNVGWNTYASCLVLVGEIIRNYCKYGPAKAIATWSTSLEPTRLVIRVGGNTNDAPAAQTFAMLNNFMEILDLGETSISWNRDKRYGLWQITVNLA